MSVLIKGMGFPAKENFMTQLYLICDKDGNWYAVDTTNKDLYKLIEVKEPHGRLGDLDALYEEISNGNKAYNGFDGYDGKYPNIGNVDDCLGVIKYTDTVIEAEGETK